MRFADCSISEVYLCWSRRYSTLALACLLAGILLLQPACGGGPNGGAQSSPAPGPPAATSSITSVAVSPQLVTLAVETSQQFTALVKGTGAFSSTVTWAVNGVAGGTLSTGTISSSGLYTAPSAIPAVGTISASATSIDDATKSDTARITIGAPPPAMPTITAISPTVGAPGDSLQIIGSNFGNIIQTVVFTGPNGLPISTLVNSGSATALTVQVPLEAAAGPIFVQVPGPRGETLISNSVSFTRVPDLRIRAKQRDLGSNESTTFQAVFFGTPTKPPIVWATDRGNISTDGTYTAPSSLQTDVFSHVSACIQGTQICDTLILGLHPFRVSPMAPAAPLGQGIQLESLTSGMPVSADWSQLTGGGQLLSDGRYTASPSAIDGGSTLVAAAYQGIIEQASIAVTGGFPGIVNRLYDYLDLTSAQLARVTQAKSVVASANRMYVLSAQNSDLGALDLQLLYIDVYDITDPINPEWLNSVEAATDGQLYVFGGVLYDIGGTVSPVIAAYDISGASPLLIGRQMLPPLFGFSFYGGVLSATEQSSQAAGVPAVIDQFLLGSANIIQRQISLPPPLTGTSYSIAAVAANQTRLYVTEVITSGNPSSILVSYDITKTPPLIVGSVALPETQLTADGYLTGSRFYTDQKIFDITEDPPVLLGTLPENITVIDGDSTRILGRTLQNGLRVIDVTDSSHARLTTELLDYVIFNQHAALSGSYIYSCEGLGGVAVYDVSASGGPQFKFQLGSSNPGSFVALGQAANATTLFAAGQLAGGGGVSVYDLQQQPPLQIGFISTGQAPSDDLVLAGNNLFVGTEESLLVFDVSQPSQPQQIGSVNVPINSLAASGSFLFAGTADGRLIVYNVSAPSSPVPLASVNLPDRAIQLAVNGTVLLVADRTGGLLVLDISIPSNPVLISQLTVPPAVFGVQSDGNLVLLAALETGLVIVDLSNPLQPQILSETALDSDDPFDAGFSDFQNRAAMVARQNQIVFVGVNNFGPDPEDSNGNGGVYGFDYRQPQHPRLISSSVLATGLNGEVTSLFVLDSSLFVSGDLTGLVRLDIANPRNTINLYYAPNSLRMQYPPPLPLPMVTTGQPIIGNKWRARDLTPRGFLTKR